MRRWGQRSAALRALGVAGLVAMAVLAGFAPAASASGYAVVATIPTGATSNPSSVAYDSATGLIYVGDSGEDAVTVIDPASNAIVATIPLETSPPTENNYYVAVAVDASTDTIYATDFWAGEVAVIDGATNAVTAHIAVGAGPESIAVDEASQTAYVANANSSSISVLDLATSTVSATAPTPSSVRPWAVALDPTSGEVVFDDQDNAELYALSGNSAVAVAGLSGQSAALAIDPATATIYAAAETTLDAVVEGSWAVTSLGSVPVGWTPEGLALDPSAGIAFIPGISLNAVAVVKVPSDQLVADVKVGSSPFGVAVDQANGAAYVANFGSNTVSVIGGSGGSSGSTPGTIDVNSGALSFLNPPGNLAFPAVTLDGRDQSVLASLGIDLGDNTGLGAGWQLDATGTELSDGSHSLPADAVTVDAAPNDACDTGATCTLATDAVSYPYVLPTGTSPPAATALFSAATGTGMGDQTVTPVFSLAVPANAAAGAYSATWTFSLVAGP